MKKSDYFYQLPEHLIAQRPLPERSASRLLYLDSANAQIRDKHFSDFIDLVSSDDLLVFNNTKVIPARLFGQKATGGKVEILIERVLGDDQALTHIRASKAPKPDSLIILEQGYCCRVLGRDNDLFHLSFQCDKSLLEMLTQIGHIPLPPYIDRADDQTDITRYQTVFAQEEGAVAAPTAGLHFSEEILEKLRAKGVPSAFVTLHVGSGTFQPVRVEDLSQHIMHKEYFAVREETVKAVEQARARGGRVIAIGTTSVRALESASQSGCLSAGFGDTELFITPGYQFKSVDALLTNFHLPESTLLMLVSAFSGYENIMKAYQHAIEQQYRFFSYGDAMLLTR
ncbi:MAG: tRNA preQ1(34) S-adenosylmethionine ribosyltransferase-isomerase QueA [Methylicorpusculum sp.]|uniref:tRNA preQ1(34) S-adenosylmethionine ribosyltransferase-isomerase QueA n=1 Tax=Methylicorpusculum sp. TaxID=2713644 RepID=UPI002723FAF3|nr:tRNA preQ1(34) S-adenosylmethionine ribosyltransferase-isomerase QueA [Methylicorpusculum sp.]MDO8844283.1 tRNA preQ1(34) S-adenosylmethionine ribosyltransferase-isomerase QueA [Methylicorpusculum sp.]MDO8939852.1 tRNA preQ1(34) S-adenosylmethionine ribosyltransferase-isomerase QueA [Methylicorpusculum sp.]MDP2178795.1 tRNA preQ1(34) S-adenosylmethionine ribosyltransferase-isomerase QueA [Methylicorpusculum sp.]MDP2202965.1 tRNA preQ1(34) S-adenosylmethionine ribosyltransferase-isomerase Que